jgi:hypothetical protein
MNAFRRDKKEEEEGILISVTDFSYCVFERNFVSLVQ